MEADIQTLTSSWNEEVAGRFDRAEPAFAIIDPAVDKRFGIADILRSLHPEGSVTVFTDFSPNPSWESFASATAAADAGCAQSVIAIGGGTAMDLGKLVAAALQLGGCDQVWDGIAHGEEHFSERPDIRLMAIPTTAGTGAEATRFAVLYRDGTKFSVAGDALMPDAWALDPSLLTTLPATVIADAGLDAACQAMESLWSVRSSSESEAFAWTALDLAIQHLENAVNSPDPTSLAGMLVAAHLAGRAINLTTTTAPHALSYGLTSLLGVPHGRAVALLFGSIFSLNAASKAGGCRHSKGSGFVRGRLEEIAERWGQTSEGFPVWWRSYLEEGLHVPPLPATENSPELVEKLIQSVNAARLANNPRTLTPEDIEHIYQSLFEAESSQP